jgi:hypothetical protein
MMQVVANGFRRYHGLTSYTSMVTFVWKVRLLHPLKRSGASFITNYRKMPFTRSKNGIDEGRLSVVAFVEDKESNQVLQSAYRRIRN